MRILIYSVSAGAGHVRAAEAVLAALRHEHPHVEAEHVDLMTLVPTAFKKAYADSFLKMVHSLPSVWGWLYAKSDRIPETSALTSIRKFVQELNTKDILAHAAERKPDVILATHFLPAEIFSDLKKRSAKRKRAPVDGTDPETAGERLPKLAVVITDHDVHQLWVHPNVDRYYTASDEISYLLAERGIPAERIRTTGIPCDPVFSGLMDEPARQKLRRVLGLADAPKRTLLMNAHGCGITGAGAAKSLGEVLSEVLKKGPPMTLLVICGRNENLAKALEAALDVPHGSLAKVYGYVSNMHELMGISDLIVAKPGGLTSSECLARCLPMVMVSPIPGQEERNAEMLLENGCAVLARTPAALAYKLEVLLNSPALLDTMREACRRTGKPRAAMDIADDLVELNRI